MEKKPLKYGLVGYGQNALGHRLELEKHPKLQGRTELIVIYEPIQNSNLKKEKLIKSVDSFEDLLDTPELEALIICSPPQYHAEQAITALESGLHVYSEIPMAIKESDLERIINAEQNSGKIYQLGENYCFIPEILYASYLSSTNRIGPTVYAESEYLHDVTYRWRKDFSGDVDTPRQNSWYELFDPLMYAHSIGPAQVAMGGLKNPMPFVDVVSYANDIGGYQGKPICSPAKAFHVALFRTETEAIAKCANAYIFAREPARIIIQLVGRIGAYECYRIGKPGYLFLADGHIITKTRYKRGNSEFFYSHRKGKSEIIDKTVLSTVVTPYKGQYSGASVRIIDDWLTAIENKQKPALHARIGGNFCIAGIAASKSARSGGKRMPIKSFTE